MDRLPPRRYRITDTRGRTIGYAKDQGSELAELLLGSILMIGLAIILVPLVAVGYGVVLSIQGFLIFWHWARFLPLTPFPNLNGVLAILALGIAGALLVKYVRIHHVLLFSVGHIVSLLASVFLAAFWMITVLITIGIAIGLPILAVSWLFSTDIFFSVIPQAAQRLSILFSPWFAPVLFPLGWICAKVIGRFDKKDRFVTASNLTPSVGLNFLLAGIFSWAGMFLLDLYFSMDEVLLLAFGPFLGAALWGGFKGLYKFTIRHEPLDLRRKES